MWTENFQMFKLDLEKGRGTRDQIASIRWIIEKAREFQKNIYFYAKPLNVWITTNCGNFLQRWEYQTTLSASWEISAQVKKQELEPDLEQQTGSKLGEKYIKVVYCHRAYLNLDEGYIMWNAGLHEAQLESRLLGEIPITSEMQMTPPLWQKVKRS